MGRRKRKTTKTMALNGLKYAVLRQGNDRVLYEYTGSNGLTPENSRIIGACVDSFKETGNPKQVSKQIERRLGSLQKKTRNWELKYVVYDEKPNDNKTTVKCHVYDPKAVARLEFAQHKRD